MATDRIVIVGGGVVGSSIAWHLRTGGFGGDVVVVERDPTYRRASSFLAMGGVRQQFGSAANIRLAQHSVRFYERFDSAMRTAEHQPRAWFRQRGYLFLANDDNAERFERRYARQRALGARVERLDVDAVRALVPDLAVDDIRFGIFGPDDGYANPREVLAGFRHAAAAAGATYVTGEVTRLRVSAGH
ncbi:MAG: FAD-dependent oxidoreductase, partial [Acidobacteria bacterium]|nr:FAD-dependent oxidoreductase [Acidobacteriota bacterium]